MTRRIGILGGTFDPIHIGHLVAAVNVRHSCRLDLVLMEVAANPWQKLGSRRITPAEVRYEAVKAAVVDLEGIEASRLEIDRSGLTYSVDTLRHLRRKEQDAELFLVGGTDMAAGLPAWHESDEVARLARIIVVNRPGVASIRLPDQWHVEHVEIPALDISSTDLRKRFVDGRPLDFLVPKASVEVIAPHHKYADETVVPSEPPGPAG